MTDEKFDKKLTNKILPKFALAKEWLDLTTALKYLQSNIEKYQDTNMGKLTDKITLAKRLAHCLNQKLPPGTHEIDINIYSMLFSNIKTHNNNLIGEDLGLYSSGLFPFFAYASTPNKEKFLIDIIKKHYLTLELNEFMSCLSGMLSSILCGLEEQNESVQKLIKDIFKESREKVGDSYFFGTLWSLIFRNNKLRIDCIKYINDVVPEYKDITEKNNADEVIMKFYPNLHVLVLNSLKELVENSDSMAQRLGMDFIISRFPISNTIFSEDDKISLLSSALKLLVKNDYSTTRRLFIWLLGNNQDDEIEYGDPNIQYMVQLLTKTIEDLFDKLNNDKTTLINLIKIVDQLFKQQVKLVDYILEPISVKLIITIQEYIQYIEGGNKYENKFKRLNEDEVILKIKIFYSYDARYLDLLWNSLSKKLTALNRKREENNVEELGKIMKIVDFCLEFLSLVKIDKKIKYYIPIISSMMKSLEIVKVNKILNKEL